MLGGQLGVGSTPTIFLNNRKLGAGVVDPAGLDALIELELKIPEEGVTGNFTGKAVWPALKITKQ